MTQSFVRLAILVDGNDPRLCGKECPGLSRIGSLKLCNFIDRKHTLGRSSDSRVKRHAACIASSTQQAAAFINDLRRLQNRVVEGQLRNRAAANRCC